MSPVPTAPPESLRPGARLNVVIDDIAFGGEGVARVDGFVIFVPFVLPQEEVKVEITELKKSFARARLVQVCRPSPSRITPRCPYFGECGGCQYQHIDYPVQLQLKHKQVVDLFQRIGKLSPTLIAPPIPSPQIYGYRNRIMIRSQWDKFKQGLNIGFIRADNRLVVDIDQCQIAEPALNEQIKHVRTHPPPKGGLKVVLRVAPENWVVPPDSFFQNNFFMLPQLVQAVRDCLTDSKNRYLVDAYCGVGFFGLELAEQVTEFVGIEIDPQAAKAARRNAERRRCANGAFLSGRTEDLLPEVLRRFQAHLTTVVLDPPRIGCPPPALEMLAQLRPSQVLYISCHPATLARDLNVLCSQGVFDCKKVVPLDMFPQTQHMECLADLRLKPDFATLPAT